MGYYIKYNILFVFQDFKANYQTRNVWDFKTEFVANDHLNGCRRLI